jgi:hypothetical protein|tara:strand:- start:1786 stop:2451 length:666 start_codon:yes stop_codon:yes gene_type:complete
MYKHTVGFPTQEQFNTLWDANIGAFWTHNAYRRDDHGFTTSDELRDDSYQQMMQEQYRSFCHLNWEDETLIGVLQVHRIVDSLHLSYIADLLEDGWEDTTGCVGIQMYINDSHGDKNWLTLIKTPVSGKEGAVDMTLKDACWSNGIERLFSNRVGSVQKQYQITNFDSPTFRDDIYLNFGLSSTDGSKIDWNIDDNTTVIVKLISGSSFGWPETHSSYKVL